jgi:hypothetical protein
LSKDFPAQYGHNPNYRNPQGTVPFPRPHDMPTPYWSQTNTAVSWTGPTAQPSARYLFAEAGESYSWTFKPPVFDLRPDLRSSDSQAKEGAVPIWNRAARLYFSIQGATNAFAVGGVGNTTPWDNMHVYLQHHGNVMTHHVGGNTRATVVPISPLLTITNTMMVVGNGDSTGPFSNTVYLTLAAPGSGAGGGDGYPIRYWSPRLTFTKFYATSDGYAANSPPPPLSFNAVYY